MPSTPLIHLELVIMDNPINPFRFESFLNVAEEDQANTLGLKPLNIRLFQQPEILCDLNKNIIINL